MNYFFKKITKHSPSNFNRRSTIKNIILLFTTKTEVPGLRVLIKNIYQMSSEDLAHSHRNKIRKKRVLNKLSVFIYFFFTSTTRRQ